jgi:hypothetical protein
MSSTSSNDAPWNFDTSTLRNPAAIMNYVISQTQLRGAAHLLVDLADFAVVGLERETPLFKDPTLNPPDNDAHLPILAKAYLRECDMERGLKEALLKYLQEVLPDVYDDCVTECGGIQNFHKLKLPTITRLMRAEIAVTDDASQVSTLLALTNEGIQLTDKSPLRALRVRVMALLVELKRAGYDIAAPEFLRRVRIMFNVYCPTHNLLQIGYSAYHTACTVDVPATGEGLLKHMSALEATTRAQGSELFPETIGTQQYAAKAVQQGPTTKTSGSALSTYLTYLQAQLQSPLTALQQEVMMKHMEAAVSAVKFAGAHPKDTKQRAHFCPVHMFNDTHPEAECNACKNLSK